MRKEITEDLILALQRYAKLERLTPNRRWEVLLLAKQLKMELEKDGT